MKHLILFALIMAGCGGCAAPVQTTKQETNQNNNLPVIFATQPVWNGVYACVLKQGYGLVCLPYEATQEAPEPTKQENHIEL